MKPEVKPVYEYINTYLYIVVYPLPERGENSFLYCSGVDTHRFFPLTEGTHGIGSNPAVRGNQLTHLDVSSSILKAGGHTVSNKVPTCGNIGTPGGVWNIETMIIENVSESVVVQMMPTFVMKLMSRIVQNCIPTASIPQKLPSPEELERYLDSLSKS